MSHDKYEQTPEYVQAKIAELRRTQEMHRGDTLVCRTLERLIYSYETDLAQMDICEIPL